MKYSEADKESKVKEHFKKHKVKYLAGLAVVGVGTVCYFVGKHYGSSKNIAISSSDINNQIGVMYKGTVNNNMANNITNIYNMSRPGHAGNIVYCPELDKSWSSQRNAEKDLKLSSGTVSKILNGFVDSAPGGLTFKKIGDFNSDSPRLEGYNS